MFIPHETFSLWLILSVGIHVATLALWPLPPSWTAGQPSYVVVDLRPAGGPTGDSSTASGKNSANTPEPSNAVAPSQPTIHTSATSPTKPKVTKKAPKPLVIPEPTPLPTELSTNPAKTYKQATQPAPVPSQEIEGASESEPTVGSSAISSELPGGSPGGSANVNNGVPGSGTSGSGTGQGMLRATPLGYGDNPPMPYPHSARRRGWEGDVLLRVDVSANGTVISAHIETSSGYGILDDTALQTVSNWRFRPASINRTPKADTVLVPVHFKLHNPQ